jgi:hypothetical protein
MHRIFVTESYIADGIFMILCYTKISRWVKAYFHQHDIYIFCPIILLTTYFQYIICIKLKNEQH